MSLAIKSALFFKWGDFDIAFLLIFVGILFSIWVFFGFWPISIIGILLIIYGFFIIYKNYKSKKEKK